MRIREAKKDDMDTVVRLRLAFVGDAHGRSDLSDEFAEETRAYVLAEHATRGARSWLAEVDGDAVGAVTLLLRSTPPHPDNLRTVEGYVINMYVAPSHRRGGIARQLLEALMRTARDRGLRRVSLHAKEAGRPLYEQNGFATDRSWMQLDL